MHRIYLTVGELGCIPSFDPVMPPPPNVGIYWYAQETKILLVVVVARGILATLAEVERVASHEERQKRIDEDNALAATSLPTAQTAAKRMELLAPEYIQELMAQFVEKKDLNERQKIRRRIRAVLDLFSADTMWPKGENAPPGPRPFGGGFAQGPIFQHDGPRRREPDDLAEPPPAGAEPVPGADLAQAGMAG